jgi:predicted dehydrogenase
MSNNINVLVVGAGKIAQEYIKILLALNVNPIVVTRGLDKARQTQCLFENVKVFDGGVENYLLENKCPDYSIIATPTNTLYDITKLLIRNGSSNLLVEKPGVFSHSKSLELYNLSKEYKCNISIAFNRRAFQSVQKAKELIEKDGGVSSLHFDFSEATYRQSEEDILYYDKEALEYWGIGNSSHVIDTVFYLAGSPKWLKCEQYGDDIKWHPKGSIFTGIGESSNGAPITYHSNWSCPGKWNIEIMTKNRKLIFSPMEKLKQQNLKSFLVEEIQIDYDLDKLYKPGFYIQVKEFLNNRGLFNINELPERLNLLIKIFNY